MCGVYLSIFARTWTWFGSFFTWCKSCGVAMVSTAEYIVQNKLNRCYRICGCRNGRDYIPSSTLLVNPLQPQILDLVCSFYC